MVLHKLHVEHMYIYSPHSLSNTLISACNITIVVHYLKEILVGKLGKQANAELMIAGDDETNPGPAPRLGWSVWEWSGCSLLMNGSQCRGPSHNKGFELFQVFSHRSVKKMYCIHKTVHVHVHVQSCVQYMYI